MRMKGLIAGCCAALLAAGCGAEEGGPAGDPEKVNVSADGGGLVTLDGVAVRVPSGAVDGDAELSLQAMEDVPLPGGLAGTVSTDAQPMRIELDEKLSKPARIRFDVSDVPKGRKFMVLTRRGDEDWHAIRSRRSGDALIVRTEHFSDYWPIDWSPRDAVRKARHSTATWLGLRQDKPDCKRAKDGLKLDMDPDGSDAVWPCLKRSGDGMELRLVSNRSVALDVRTPDGWTIKNKKGSSLGEDAWEAVSGALRKAGLDADPPLLPAGGEMTLKAPTAGPAKITLSANNTALTFDTMLEAFAAVYKGAKGVEAKASEIAELAVCAKASWNGSLAQDIAAAVDLFADCGTTVFKELPKAFLTAVLTSAAKTVGGVVDSISDVFGSGSSATLRLNGYGETKPKKPSRPKVDPSQAQIPTCRDWVMMDAAEGDAALERMMAAYGQDGASLSTARLSVGVYCKLNPGRTIDGVYSPSSRSGQPAGGDGPIPTCAEWREMDNAAADAAIERMMAQRGDTSSLSTARLSVGAYCSLYPGRKIDGVYSG